jgi:murein DD-endopeptidase MepM/ murein hydrolase activator NlpD
MVKEIGSVLAALLLPLPLLAEQHSAFPIDVVAGPPPQAVRADGKTHLVYELHLTNFAGSPIQLLSLTVSANASDAAAPLAAYKDADLERLLVAVGGSATPNKLRSIPGGRSVVVFLDLALPAGARLPTELRHLLSLSIPRKKDGSGGMVEDTVNGPAVPVVREPAPVLRAPLRGPSWAAFNSLGGDAHRRALVAVDGRERIAQRFAIDWMLLGPDGRFFHGDPKSNGGFYGYGAEVLAVADGRVSDRKDGLPENAGSNEATSRNITLDNVAGNSILLDLGHGRFAMYAHLQPGSLRVKVGDRVTAGQVLALLGNSGNSDAPHLHFQVMDANSPLGAEGLPYEIDRFTQLGIVRDVDGTLAGNAWKPQGGEAPAAHRDELPTDAAVVGLLSNP